MFLPCPHCGYLITLVLPTHAPGQHVDMPRCPRCEGVLVTAPADARPPQAGDPRPGIDADESLADETLGSKPTTRVEGDDADDGPTTHAAETQSHPRGHPPPAGDDPAGNPATQTDASTGPDVVAPFAPATAVPRVGREALPGAIRGGKPRRTPSFVRGTQHPARARLAWPWYAAIVALGLLLALQLLLAQRHELAASARWRPSLMRVCNVLRCDIPPWHEPRAFTMLARNVQPSPTTAGVLLVEARFRNDARWPQRWPRIFLSLSDVEGRPVGARAFVPGEYRLAATSTDLLAPGQSATVRLQLREPARPVVP